MKNNKPKSVTSEMLYRVGTPIRHKVNRLVSEHIIEQAWKYVTDPVADKVMGIDLLNPIFVHKLYEE